MIDTTYRNFFWKDNCDYSNYTHKLQIIACDKIHRPECESGLGIRKTKEVTQLF